jgi:hypothetical protein
MAPKWSVAGVVRDHARTLRDDRTRRYRVRDFLEFYGIPVGIGAAAYFTNFKLDGIEATIGGMAIFTALLFGLLVQVFTLRIRVADSTSLRADIDLGRLIDQLEANVSYTVLVGIALTATLVVIAAVAGTDDPAPVGPTAAVAALFSHFLLSSFMVLKRLRSAYSSARY